MAIKACIWEREIHAIPGATITQRVEATHDVVGVVGAEVGDVVSALICVAPGVQLAGADSVLWVWGRVS